MISYTQRQLWKGSVATNTDKVFSGIVIPPGGVFRGCSIDMHVWGAETVLANALMYGISAYLVPVLDPDSQIGFDALWDRLVPKDVAEGASALDLDTTSADATPEFELGDLNFAAVYDVGSAPVELYRRRRLLTAALRGSGLAATGAFTHWLPTDKFRISVPGGQRVNVPSVLMFGMSSPVLDRTTATSFTEPTEREWLQLQYLEDTALDALKFLMGLHEAGAESPYEEASDLLARTLEPLPFEQVAGEFASGTWQIVASAVYAMSVPGTLQVDSLDSEG